MKLVLASSSPRRIEILKNEGYNFLIEPAEIDESFSSELDVYTNVLNTSYKKAFEIKKNHQSDVILGCDTTVCLNNICYGKPKDELDAYKMLKSFSGKAHEVVSGVCILHQSEMINFYVKTLVYFKELSDEMIYDYIKTKECFGKAGAYAIQGIGKSLVLKYEGELANVIGLPIKEIKPLLDKYEF